MVLLLVFAQLEAAVQVPMSSSMWDFKSACKSVCLLVVHWSLCDVWAVIEYLLGIQIGCDENSSIANTY